MPAFQEVQEIFIRDRIARLMRMEESEQTRYQFEVWFEYTRQTMAELREGTLLAVRNFATTERESRYSILEVVSIMPVHYALGESPSGYPGFVMEAARNIATDWLSQEDRSQEDTTVIRCTAVPTGLELVESSDGRDLTQEQGLPMIGADVKVLNCDATKVIVNREIDSTRDNVFAGGIWLVDDRVPIYIRAEDFVRVHFGIFGFTGVGKSNIVSTYVNGLLQAAQERERPVKIVLFDLMSEYGILLIDQLCQLPESYLLALDEHALPGTVVEFLSGNAGQRENAVNHLMQTSLYPKAIERNRQDFVPAFSLLLNHHKIRIYQVPTPSFSRFLSDNEGILIRGNLGGSRQDIFTLRDNLRQQFGNQPLTPQIAQAAISMIRQTQQGNLTTTAMNNLSEFRRLLEDIQSQPQRSYPTQVSMTHEAIIEELNNQNRSALFIIQSHDPDDLRDFAFALGRSLYDRRRSIGIITPPVSFVFDEADEFIPLQYERDSSYSRSAWIAETLARRGRKFGIGVGICTQRVANLKTNVMAQPHTYLISKLPREYDRIAIQSAFGFSQDMFRQTFKFVPGDWLLVSHDATGMKGVPIPIHAEDANQRILAFLNNLNSS